MKAPLKRCGAGQSGLLLRARLCDTAWELIPACRIFAGAMERCFFHVCNGDGFTQDKVGRPMRDIEAARKEATRIARSIMAEEMQSGQMNLASFVEVEDQAGQLLFTLTFPEAVEIKT